MDTFTRSYLEAALWSSNDESTPEGGDPMDDNYNVEDIHPDTIEAAERDCASFQALAGDLLNEGTNEQAGHDFWLTRNGHGAGFWDGDWPIGGDRLTELSKGFGEATLWLGDNGQIHAT